jgi:hypothetical protein
MFSFCCWYSHVDALAGWLTTLTVFDRYTRNPLSQTARNTLCPAERGVTGSHGGPWEPENKDPVIAGFRIPQREYCFYTKKNARIIFSPFVIKPAPRRWALRSLQVQLQLPVTAHEKTAAEEQVFL